MDKDLELIVDQLMNDEVSSDEMMAKFLSQETRYSFERMQMLVGACRGQFLRQAIMTNDEAIKYIKSILIKIDNS